MGCGMGMIKYLLFIFNFIFAICGLAILIVGIIAQLQLQNVASSIAKDNQVFVPSIALIVVGSIIFIVSFFGCCGAIRESHCMTITFASFLLTILIVQVAIAVFAFVVLRNNVKEFNVSKSYDDFLKTYYVSNENEQIIDTIQQGLTCCGANSPNDFLHLPSTNGSIPNSCCENSSSCSISTAYKEGCSAKIEELIKLMGTVIGGIAIGIAAVELIGIIFALCLANSIKNTERRGYRV